MLVDQLKSKPEQENNEITVYSTVHMVWYISDCTVTDVQTDRQTDRQTITVSVR